MENPLLALEVQEYINDHLDKNNKDLAFKKSPFQHIEMSDLLMQIEAKQKCIDKLPTWYNSPNILYPAKLSIEQTSSEVCAKYKANLVFGESLIDLTGGFGVDCLYFANHIKQVVHCEMQSYLSHMVAHNYNQLGVKNITTHCGDSLVYIAEQKKQWDWIYVDPARRNQSKEKVFFLSDCLPNVPEHLELLFSHTNNVLIKTSPLLDIHAGLNELKHVSAIHIIALNNEVKELLWVLKKGSIASVELTAVNIHHNQISTFKTTLDQSCEPVYALPKKFLYEPNSAVLKTGKFDCICPYYKIEKLHQHSQLYTSDNLIENFAGRSFEIQEVIPYNKANAKLYLTNTKANVTTRNFPIKVEELRKKWKIKDGGEQYLFFTTLNNQEKVFIKCLKTKIETKI